MAPSSFCAHCGAENVPTETLCHICQQPLDLQVTLAGTSALLHERYEILGQVGVGGFGAVYQARDTREDDQSLVAIKQINLTGLSSQEIIEATDAFNREAEILSTLSHPLLPRIFDRFSDSQHWYLVMSFIEGQTLGAYLQQVSSLPNRVGLPLGETLAIGQQLCDVLHYLHTQEPPVIFRDLKPSNIMRTPSGRISLIDFGIARRFKPGQLKDTLPFGSPGFAAPEQYGRSQTTPRADIYSLGALLFCLISGEDPSEHPFQFPPLSLDGVDGIRELDALIHRMVSLDPMQRPSNLVEVQAELLRLQRFANHANELTRIWTPPRGQMPPPFPVGDSQQQSFGNPQQIGRKIARRRMLTTSLIFGGVVALTGGIATAMLGLRLSQHLPTSQSIVIPDLPTLEAQDATATVSHQASNSSQNSSTFWSLDLSHMAVIDIDQGQMELYKVPSQQALQIINISPDFSLPMFSSYPRVQWSSDNRKILMLGDTGLIEVWNTENGEKLFTFTNAEDSWSVWTTWSPDGQMCGIGYWDGQGNRLLSILQASDGKELFQIPLSDQIDFSLSSSAPRLAWSPTSRYLAFPEASVWSPGTPWMVAIWDVQTRQKSGFFGAMIPSDAVNYNNVSSISWSPGGQKLAALLNNYIWLSQFGSSQPASIFVTVPYSTTNFGPTWSPDEKFLAVILDGNLTVWETSSKRTIQFQGSGSPGNFVAFAWSADSQSIATADVDNILAYWQVG